MESTSSVILLIVSSVFFLRGLDTAPTSAPAYSIPYEKVNIDSKADGFVDLPLIDKLRMMYDDAASRNEGIVHDFGRIILVLDDRKGVSKSSNDSESRRQKRFSQEMYEGPRCGVSDYASQGITYKWNKMSLTYYIDNFPAYISSADVEQLLQRAFNEWSRVTNLDFTRTYDQQAADFNIGFGSSEHLGRYSQYCSVQFESDILAHAFYPQSGEIHFNTAFYFNRHNQDQFFHTAVHEIGHALGLDHSMSRTSIMYPSLGNILSELSQRDIESIQMIYGKRPPPLHVQYGFLWPGK